MKVGDDVKLESVPEYGTGKIIRFHASHGTVLVNFEKCNELKYCNYYALVQHDDS